MSLVELARYFTSMEAEINRTRLLSFGIETMVFDGSMNIADGANLHARLMILPEDLEEARQILATPPDESEIDEAEQDSELSINSDIESSSH